MPFSADVFLPPQGRGDVAELYAEESSRLLLRREEGRLEEVTQSLSSGTGLRMTRGRQTLFGHREGGRPFSEGLSSSERRGLAALSRELAGPGRLALRRLACRPASAVAGRRVPAPSGLEAKIALLERAERAARQDPAVRQVALSYSESVRRVGLASGDGGFEEERTYSTFTVQVTAARGGLLQTGYEALGGTSRPDLLEGGRAAEAASLAARRAVAKLSAPAAPLGEMAVVIASEAGGTLIHEAIGHALEADAIQDGSSPHFAGKVGRTVANERVTVLDDPTVPGRRGSFLFDDEGIPAERTVLVENGVLKTYLYDRLTARRDGRRSNGHGRRESFAHKPIPRMSNTFIAPGRDDPREIVRSLKRGLLVTRMGGGQVDTASGDFVFEVEEGFWVEDGRPRRMVRGANLLGNGPDALKSIDRVGRDLGWSLGTCGKEGQGVPVADGVPTVRLPKLVVGGT